jgi:hypothetical protein
MPKIVSNDSRLRANASHKCGNALKMSDLVSQNLKVEIANTGRTTFLWRGRSEGKIQVDGRTRRRRCRGQYRIREHGRVQLSRSRQPFHPSWNA